jgi:pantetheine-phosphate adenylyltransferase
METKAIYPGTFDPITNGHLDIIKRAYKLFTNLTVVIYDNPRKKCFFTLEERFQMTQKAIETIPEPIKIDLFEQKLLVEYCHENNCQVIVRGLRAVTDFEYEFQMELTNKKLSPEIETIYLMTSQRYSFLSSSMVREIAMLGGKVSCFVPESVTSMIKKKSLSE